MTLVTSNNVAEDNQSYSQIKIIHFGQYRG
jgi:hypothetical protein